MNRSNKSPAFDIAFSELCTSSLERTYHSRNKEKPTKFQGMSVKTLHASFPVYLNQPDINKIITEPFIEFKELNSAYQKQVASSDNFAIDLPDIPQSILDDDYSIFDKDFSIFDDQLLSDLANKPIDDNITITDSTPKNYQTKVQQSPAELSSVTFSSQSSHPVSVLNKGAQKQVQTESTVPVSTNRGNVVNSLKRSYSEHSGFESVPKKLTKKSDTFDKAKKNERVAYQTAYHYAYHDKLKELVSEDIFEQIKEAAQTAGKLAGQSAENITGKRASYSAYTKAYNHAHKDKLKELVSSDIIDQAKATAQAAGRAASQAARDEAMLADGSAHFPPT